MNSAKRLTLAEIEALPKASVIWYEWHILEDEDTGIDYYGIMPALVSIPGKNGVICYSNGEFYNIKHIDEKLITNDTQFWNFEPDTDMIKRGVSEDYYNNVPFVSVCKQAKKLITAITSRGYEISRFCSLCGFDEQSFIEMIQGERELSAEEMQTISEMLNMPANEERSVFYPGIIYDILTGKPIEQI